MRSSYYGCIIQYYAYYIEVLFTVYLCTLSKQRHMCYAKCSHRNTTTYSYSLTYTICGIRPKLIQMINLIMVDQLIRAVQVRITLYLIIHLLIIMVPHPSTLLILPVLHSPRQIHNICSRRLKSHISAKHF